MFPIPWNKAYRKKDGSLTTIDDAIDEGGGSYELPTASANTKGGVKVGNRLTMNGETLNADEQLPSYTTSDEGKVLGVDSNGHLEWSTPSSGGSISYVDFDNVGLTVLGNGIGIANIQATATSGLVGKRIVSGNCRSGNAISVIDAIAPHDPIEENDWIVVTGINRTSEAQSASKIRLWYV